MFRKGKKLKCERSNLKRSRHQETERDMCDLGEPQVQNM